MNKTHFFSVSLVLFSMLTSAVFFNWALNASYDSDQLEKQGHNAYAAKQYQQAYQAFLSSAAISAKEHGANNKNIAHLYRYAGSSAYKQKNYERALEKVTISLRYNPDNAEAIHLIKHMLHNKQVTQQQVSQVKTRLAISSLTPLIYRSSLEFNNAKQ